MNGFESRELSDEEADKLHDECKTVEKIVARAVKVLEASLDPFDVQAMLVLTMVPVPHPTLKGAEAFAVNINGSMESDLHRQMFAQSLRQVADQIESGRKFMPLNDAE